MKKLALNIEELAVESFETSRDMERRGTVRGASESTEFQIICTCDSDNGTCDASCQGGCGTGYTCSCNGTCGGDTCGPCTNDFTCATGFQIQCSCP
ncbi:MAG TPA: pinensin family lanthipeptide [Longimicrobium sp.]|nr:pinensin family lanthipeptide [Longimicrobium sp.]